MSFSQGIFLAGIICSCCGRNQTAIGIGAALIFMGLVSMVVDLWLCARKSKRDD